MLVLLTQQEQSLHYRLQLRCARFYVATGATTRNPDFFIPVEAVSPPYSSFLNYSNYQIPKKLGVFSVKRKRLRVNGRVPP